MIRIFFVLLGSILTIPVLANTPVEHFTAELARAQELKAEEQYEPAITILESLRRITQTVEIPAQLQAKALRQLGVCYANTGNHTLSTQYWKQVVIDFVGVIPDTHRVMIGCYRNLGISATNIEDYENAIPFLLQAIQSIQQLSPIPTDLRRKLVGLYRNAGYGYSQVGELQKAKNYLDLALALAQEIHQDELWEIGEIYNDFFFYYQKLEDAPRMIISAQNAIDIYTKIADKYTEDYFNLANSYNNLGIAYDENQQFPLAVEAYLAAIKINKKYPQERQQERAKNHLNLALTYNQLQQTKEAFNSIDTAIILHPDSVHLSRCYNNRAEIYRSIGALKKALADQQLSIRLITPNFQTISPYDLPPIQTKRLIELPIYLNRLANKADVLTELGEREQDTLILQYGLATYQQLDTLARQMRLTYTSDAAKSFLAKRVKTAAENAIQTCFLLYQITEREQYAIQGLQYAEHSKATTLLEAVRRGKALPTQDVNAALLDEEMTLKRKMTRLNRRLLRGNVENVVAARQRLVDLQNQLEQLFQALKKSDSAYFAAVYERQDFDYQHFINNDLAEQQTVIEYYVGQNAIYSFRVQRDLPLSFQRSAIDFPLVQQMNELRAGIYRKYTDKNEYNNPIWDEYFYQNARFFYDYLLKNIPNLTTAKQLTIIPDGVLGYLPFEVLLTRDIDATTFGNYEHYPYFLKHTPLSYNYSLALLQEMQSERKTDTKKQLLAFAPIFNATQATRLGNLSIQLDPILFNQSLVEEIHELFGGRKFTAAQATKEKFLANASHYAYIHLASHAQMNDEDINSSFISFTQTGDSTNLDQLLFVDELYTLPLPAKMVVLSACETALGQLQDGEGIISLARAFSYAGAKSLVTTLWQVNDQQTKALMLHFYQQLKANERKDVALWQAKNIFIEDGFTAHPYFWAGFVVIGNAEAVDIQADTPLVYWLIPIALLLLIAWLLKRKYAPRTR